MQRKAKEVLKKLNNPHVRNMFWSLASPNCLNEREIPHLFPDFLMEKLWREHEDWFYLVDENPQELEEYTSKYHFGRLGHYFEAVLRFLVTRSPTIELVLSNFQIDEEKITKGEIDLVFDWNKTRYHWEITVKYFAQANSGENWNDWVGPSGLDRLDIKLNHTLNHQLPLINHPQVKKIVGENVQSYLFFKGMFYPKNHEPNFLSKKAPKGTFLHVSEVSNFIETESISEIYVLFRPHWLADLESLNPKYKMYPNNFLLHLPELLEKNWNTLHVRMRGKTLIHTLFIVADDWPNENQLSGKSIKDFIEPIRKKFNK